MIEKIIDVVGPECEDAGSAVIEIRKLLGLDEKTGELKSERKE